MMPPDHGSGLGSVSGFPDEVEAVILVQQVTDPVPGQRFIVHEQGNLTMVMTRDQSRWFCLMGEMPADKLLALAKGLSL